MDAGVAAEDFISTGRTGRRNAIADISDSHNSTVSTAGMDFSFDKLSVTDSKLSPPETNETSGASGGQNPDQLAKS
jgi:hypothetical protein